MAKTQTNATLYILAILALSTSQKSVPCSSDDRMGFFVMQSFDHFINLCVNLIAENQQALACESNDLV